MRDVRTQLISAFHWHSDPPVWPEHRIYYADDSGWWREPTILSEIGSALATLFEEETSTVVMGPESRGSLLGRLSPCSWASVSQKFGKRLIEHRMMTCGCGAIRRLTTEIGSWRWRSVVLFFGPTIGCCRHRRRLGELR